ncbi:MAG: B12-binding domain-containing radical SAM protein [Candidatus Hodarchaeota archaeon]
MSNVLVTTPLCVPSYFNAGHRLPIFVVAAYLRKQGHSVVAVDMASLSTTWKDLADLLVQNSFDIVAVLNDFDLIEGFKRFVQYVREFSPQAKIITFGRLSSVHTKWFHQYDIEGIVVAGDYEIGVAQFIRHLEFGDSPAGVQVNESNGWQMPEKAGIFLPAEEWILPDINEISYTSYDALYSNDRRKFCGIPNRRELVVPLARGCPVGCNFCEVWQREGIIERRLSVDRVVEYIEKAFIDEPFEYVSMYAPTFTLKKKWVRNLCNEFIIRDSKYPWKCTTTMFHLDKNLVRLMGQTGCFRISIGLESFEDAGVKSLPIHKHETKRRFDELLCWCNEASIQLNCFIMIGLPGTSVAGTRCMIDYLCKAGVRIRPSIFSDYSIIHPSMSEQEVVKVLSRHFLADNANFSHEERRQLYKLVFNLESIST